MTTDQQSLRFLQSYLCKLFYEYGYLYRKIAKACVTYPLSYVLYHTSVNTSYKNLNMNIENESKLQKQISKVLGKPEVIIKIQKFKPNCQNPHRYNFNFLFKELSSFSKEKLRNFISYKLSFKSSEKGGLCFNDLSTPKLNHVQKMPIYTTIKCQSKELLRAIINIFINLHNSNLLNTLKK
ncbi:hypothetical protein AGLY_010189 [Aphis glycines]|uniref:Uncharacterized protein n=1 Tax=Aphis glycines TaxID=307491 RepID=A0A6G0TGL1_APHGL|nr:hypothetical protein AGLY_010189 [Aphis glycines]